MLEWLMYSLVVFWCAALAVGFFALLRRTGQPRMAAGCLAIMVWLLVSVVSLYLFIAWIVFKDWE